jgi:hypothetical protein
VRSLKLYVSRLDTLDSDISVCATQLMADTRNLIYAFRLEVGDRLIAEGKAIAMAIPE